MISKFFINRPIVAIVISLLTILLGVVVLLSLPISQFPDVVPPEVQIQASYPGADAQTMEEAVAVPIEEQMSGADKLTFLTSINPAVGPMRMIIDFEVGSDPNTDLILSQMRSTLAQSQLPASVISQGLKVTKSFSSPLLLVSLYSPDGSSDAKFLANYAFINLNDQLTRVPGIGSVQVFGAGQYAMRIWLKPEKLAKLSLTVSDVQNAVQVQNNVNPVGQVGSEPALEGQEFTYSVRAQGRLTKPEEFEKIIVRENPDGSVVRLGDLARVELGAQDYSLSGRLNGKPCAIIALYQLPGTNAIDAARGVKALMAKVKSHFPQGVDYAISLDTTKAVSAGIREIVETLLIAIVLVVIVVYLFLQGWRATLIPLLAVPVSLIGTFAFFPLFGFSINTLSLFGLVLAIGLVVDDAIVVVEAVQRHIDDGLDPKEAAIKAMEEITAPVVGIALVLSAVFIPSAFVSGITGRLNQQFCLTIAIAVLLSAFNALTLSPALAAMILVPRPKSSGPIAKFFDWFNRNLGRVTGLYTRGSSVLIRRSWLALLGLIFFAGLAGFFGWRLPTSFLPDEDQGYTYINLQLPLSSSSQRTSKVAEQIEQLIMATPGVERVNTVIGFSLLSQAQASYSAFFFVALKDWGDRKAIKEQFLSIQNHLNEEMHGLDRGQAFGFSPPPIEGIGSASGFTFYLEDRAGKDLPFLAKNLETFLAEAHKRPEIGFLASSYLPSVPQETVVVDRDKVLKQGVALSDVYSTLQTYMGGLFINYFNRFGREWQVYLEAEAEYRGDIKRLGEFYVRNGNGDMVQLSELTKFEKSQGPEFIQHFNLYRAAQINGAPAPGRTSAEARAALEDVFAKTMPAEMGFDYGGMSYQEKRAAEGVSSLEIMAGSLLVVCLVLAALYESWSLPLSVLITTPVAIAGALGTLMLRRWVAQQYLPAYLVQIKEIFTQTSVSRCFWVSLPRTPF